MTTLLAAWIISRMTSTNAAHDEMDAAAGAATSLAARYERIAARYERRAK